MTGLGFGNRHVPVMFDPDYSDGRARLTPEGRKALERELKGEGYVAGYVPSA